MRAYLWLFLSLAVVEGLPVQEEVSLESLELPQNEGGSLVGDLLPDQDHEVQEDLKPSGSEESSVQEQPPRFNLVQEDGFFKGNSLVEPKPLDEQEDIDAKEALLQIEAAFNPEKQLCKGISFNGTCYQFFKGPMRAYDAELSCQTKFRNGHLASVTSKYIQGLMKFLMEMNGVRTSTWIGGKRYLTTDRFIWLDGAQWNYADWSPGKPNNGVGLENCVALLSNSKFSNLSCWDLRTYICSYPL